MLINSLVRVGFIPFSNCCDIEFCVHIGSEPIAHDGKIKSNNWRPRSLRGCALALLLISLAVIIVTLGVLFSVFDDTRVSQKFAISNPQESNDDRGITVLAPYSIIPTLFAVFVMRWWDSIDDTFRRLQPYVSMAQGSTPISKGSHLSYINSPPLWVTGKAIVNHHFTLALITTATVLSKIRSCSIFLDRA